MKNEIKAGDVVVFNPTSAFFQVKQKVLLGRNGQAAIVLLSSGDTHLISFEPSVKALVDSSLVEKIEIQEKRDITEEWFNSRSFF